MINFNKAANISFQWSYGGKNVYLTGSFNNWDPIKH